jgi:hypothetical protein
MFLEGTSIRRGVSNEIKSDTGTLNQIIAFFMNSNTNFFIQRKFESQDQKFGTFLSKVGSF